MLLIQLFFSVGSPIFLVKTQLQTSSSSEISVGTQHNHANMLSAFRYFLSQGDSISTFWHLLASVLQLHVQNVITQFPLLRLVKTLEYIELLSALIINLVPAFRYLLCPFNSVTFFFSITGLVFYFTHQLTKEGTLNKYMVYI